jgi:methylsterol monooxygenase
MACEYAHPIEFLISNIGSVVAGPLLFRSHLLTTWLWLFIALIGTINHHSGYRLPGILGSGLSNPDFHDFHHAKFTNNFGLLGILDRLHGTDKAWQAKKAQTRTNKKE